ncbi:MAG: glycosyltransferase family 9 protein [Desulfovibrionaceae bacterium]|nr:glycosyltransferase family 9 protein [Desulfovibrionaceae bacterium]
MRRYIINLTRLGDLLQTQAVIHGFAEQGDQVALVCLENFAGAAALLRGVDQVAALPGAALLAGLDRDWPSAAAALEDWVQAQRRAFMPDAVLNLTPTLPARLLSRLLPPRGQADGFSLDDHGFGQDGSPWATYVQAVSASRGCSPFNLVDSFRCMAGVTQRTPSSALRHPGEEEQHHARALLEAAARDAGQTAPAGFVAFQLGASNDARRWPTESFAALGRILRERAGLLPVLTGSAGERPLAGRYFAHGGPGVDCTGRTTLPELAALLTQTRLLITNDTGTMHLAAGLGVPLLALFLATAQPWDTGPYAENLCCLEPRLDCHPCAFGKACPHQGRCRQSISAEAVAALVLPRLDSGRWQPAGAASEQARVWLTCRDESGFLNLVSLSGDEETDRTLWVRLQRRFYRRLLDRLAPAPLPIPANSARDDRPGTKLSAGRRERILSVLDSADGLLHLTREQGRLLTVRPDARGRQAFLATCERLGTLFSSSPDFLPLGLLWRSMLQEAGGNWADTGRFFDALRDELRGLALEIPRCS